MSKIKLTETVQTQLQQLNSNNEIIEDLDYTREPDFTILDVTVFPDEEYQPTIQSILIDLEESNKLSDTGENLSINIISETVNPKTNYSISLFEFESTTEGIILSLTLTESEKYAGVYNVSAYTTKGVKVFETNTQCPKQVIQQYLNSLSHEYLIKETEEPKVIDVVTGKEAEPTDSDDVPRIIAKVKNNPEDDEDREYTPANIQDLRMDIIQGHGDEFMCPACMSELKGIRTFDTSMNDLICPVCSAILRWEDIYEANGWDINKIVGPRIRHRKEGGN